VLVEEWFVEMEVTGDEFGAGMMCCVEKLAQ
jgi:hypothetical protein